MSDRAGPPAERSRLWQQVNEATAAGSFRLQVCDQCNLVQYPPQEFCSHCLTDVLSWETVSPMGKVLSWTSAWASNNGFFKEKLPLHIGLVKLDCGPVMFAYLTASCLQTGSRVQVTGNPDKSGQSVFLAALPDTNPAAEFSSILTEDASS